MSEMAVQRAFPTVVFLGDAISSGGRSVTSPRRRWTSLVSEELDWHEVNLSISGMGFYRRRGAKPGPGAVWDSSAEDTTLLEAAIRLDPAAVIVCLGANDAVLLDGHEDEIRTAIDRDLRMLHHELPGSPVVIAPFFPWSPLPPRTSQVVAWLRESSGVYDHRFTDALLTAIDANPELVGEDEIHPNDAGHARLAEAILPVLRGLGQL